jgi:hypothetical protein
VTLGVINSGGKGVSVAAGVGVRVGVPVRVGVEVGVGARSEAEDGKNKLNKNENTPAASNRASIMRTISKHVFRAI